MAKNNCFILLILLLLSINLSACDDIQGTDSYIDLSRTTRIVAASNPSYQKTFESIPQELAAVVSTVDNLLTAYTKDTVQTDTSADFQTMNDLLFLTLEMDDGSLFLINIYLHTDHDGYIRCIRHSADDNTDRARHFSIRKYAARADRERGTVLAPSIIPPPRQKRTARAILFFVYSFTAPARCSSGLPS